ncbi:MAG: hypothetical protein Q7T54_04500 [Candidatus Levybacteria bacterium]|nr:hypothetical protein [Candidatus Levybacteria bacterium]
MKMTVDKVFSILPRSQIQLSENKKMSYWLEKLFNQKKNKEKRDLERKTSDTDTPLAEPPGPIEKQNLEEKGLAEAIKNRASKAEKSRQAIEDLVNKSNRILLKVSTVFPLDWFPSSIIVEETRLTVIHRQLFTSQTHSVDIKNISNIFVDSGIFFAQLTIVSDTFTENQIIINRLWKKDAIFVRRIIEGLRTFVGKDIDTTDFTVKELVSKLKELSTTKVAK